MPTVVFASSKGGAGKTTATIILASELARRGAGKDISVTLIDADPNQHSAKWALKPGCPENVKLIQSADENGLLDAIDKGEEQSAFVLVDLEGTASVSVANAVSRADLVIILCQGSQDDADEAVKTIKLIKNQSRLLRRKIPFAVLMSRTNPVITPRTLRHIIEEFRAGGVKMFEMSLIDREAFRAVRSFGGIVNHLDPRDVSGIEKAAENARAFADEVIAHLLARAEEEEKREKEEAA